MSENGSNAVQESKVALNKACNLVMGTVVRGVMTGAPGVPPDEVLGTMVFQLGAVLSTSLQGDLVTLLKLRKTLKDSFEKGLAAVPPKQAPVPPDAATRLNG